MDLQSNFREFQERPLEPCSSVDVIREDPELGQDPRDPSSENVREKKILVAPDATQKTGDEK